MIDIVPETKDFAITQVNVEMPIFTLNATESTVYVYLYTSESRLVECKLVQIPPEIYSQWAQDDNFIIDYALTELGLSRA